MPSFGFGLSDGLFRFGFGREEGQWWGGEVTGSAVVFRLRELEFQGPAVPLVSRSHSREER
jgi:hypothetical protein